MKAISPNDAFRVLKTAEKKQVFRDFIDELRREEKEDKRLRLARTRDNFKKLLEDNPDINSSTRWKYVDKKKKKNFLPLFVPQPNSFSKSSQAGN